MPPRRAKDLHGSVGSATARDAKAAQVNERKLGDGRLTDEEHKLGPIRLAPGVLPRHVLAYLFAAFISIGMFTYLVALTPYVLRVNLGLPEGDFGRASGDLQFWQEIALLSVIGWAGALSDRIGRRAVYIGGFAILAVAYASYGFASTYPQLAVLRLIYAIGVAATTTNLSAVMADYAHEDSRGKLTGIAFLLNGLGSVIFFVGLTQLPEVFVGEGASELWAGRYAYLTVSGIALFGAVVMLGLKPGKPAGTEVRTPVIQLMTEGLLAARNLRIVLSYMSAFTARADMSIITIFMTLWVVQAASDNGASTAEATAQAGMIVGLAQIAAIIWAPIYGVIGDRIDRLTLLVIGFAIATFGYGWVALTSDILSLMAIPGLLCLGMGLSSAQLGSTVLLAQEAPVRLRGSAFGMQSLCGAIGILALSLAGGRLYDAFGPQAPFVAVAVANAIVFILAALYRFIELRSPEIKTVI